jgi:acyl carrier protein
VNVEEELRQILLPVFGLETIDEIQPEHSLIGDLGAESLDFVEIIFLIEKQFGVVLETRDLMLGTSGLKNEDLFTDGRLTSEGAILLANEFPARAACFRVGMTKVDFFSLLTVRDMADIITEYMLKRGDASC